MVKLTLFAEAEKSLQKIPQKQRNKILRKLGYLAQNPYAGKKLTGELSDKYSLRVWPYRILYLIDKSKGNISVFSIAHRQGVYK